MKIICLSLAVIGLTVWCMCLTHKLNAVKDLQDRFLQAQNTYNESMLESMQDCIKSNTVMRQAFERFSEILKQMRG